MSEVGKSGEKVYRGIPVSGGVCRGKILVLGKEHQDAIAEHHIPEGEVQSEVRRLETGLVETRQQILEVQRQVSEGLGAADASIFDAHLLVLEDPTLIEEVTRELARRGARALVRLSFESGGPFVRESHVAPVLAPHDPARPLDHPDGETLTPTGRRFEEERTSTARRTASTDRHARLIRSRRVRAWW